MAMLPLGRFLVGMPCWPLHKQFRRTVFVALLQLRYHGSPFRRPPPPPELKPYHVNTIEDDNEPRTMVTSSAFHPIAFPPGHNKTLEELCASFPRHLLARIQPVLKTGFTDEPGRMLSQMESCSACFQPGDLLIFSDLDDTYRGHEIIDILATLPKSYHDFESFKPYFEQKRLRDSGDAATNPDALKAIDGWKLDKFKFLPQVQQAWQIKPNREFYVFYETDTYVFWDPLLRFLDTLDPDTPLYLGSASPGRGDEFGRNTLFANGGPSYVLSRAAVKHLLQRKIGPTGAYLDPPFAEKYRYLMHDAECCGDSALGFALWQSGIQMQALYPMFAQHPIQHLPFDAMRWCSPLFTLHKTSFDDMRGLFQWEFTSRSNDYAMRHRDIWEFQKPGSEMRRINWRNDDRFGHKVENVSIATGEECEAHCRSVGDCFMWSWRGNALKECFVSESVMLYGQEAQPEEIERKKETDPEITEREEGAPEEVERVPVTYMSGWIVDRVKEWKTNHDCNDTLWLSHSFGRMF